MKKVVVASLLAVMSVAPAAPSMFAEPLGNQAQAPAGQQSGAVQMSSAEYAVYNNAMTQTTPQTKAPALEAYLQKYPNSAVKKNVLLQLMLAYSAFDPTKALDAADRLLQVDPTNLRALTFEVYFRAQAADKETDPTAKQAALDKAADFATKGLGVANGSAPEGMSAADFDKLKASVLPTFYSAIATAALNKKDTATAIDNFKKELASVPVDQTTKPGKQLMDTYYLGSAYLQATPPDLLNCAYYVARFVAYAPEPYKTQMLPTAQYCFKRYHGNLDGYDTFAQTAQANLNPPANLSTTVTPAPKPADIAHQTVMNTPDLSTLALSDKEFILQNGSPDDAQKVFDSVKGKDVEIPDATVVSADANSVQVAVSDDALQATPKRADFTFTMKEPLKTVPAVGDKVTLTGTYDSYTQNPLMINMINSAVVTPKKAAPAHTTHHTTHHRRAH